MSAVASELPLATLSMPHGPLTYLAEGSGIPVVALHGLPGSVRDFRRLGEALPREGVRFIRLNMPGFAGSASLSRSDDWEELVATVARAAQELAGGPFVVLGHSFGGLVALRTAAAAPLARGLALLAPAGLRTHRTVRMLGPRLGLRALRASSVSQELFYRGLARTPMGARATREESDNTLALLSTLDYAASRKAARSLSMPVLCSWCRDDSVVESAIVEELLASLNVTQRLPFERGGHTPQKDHAEELGAALAAFAAESVR